MDKKKHEYVMQRLDGKSVREATAAAGYEAEVAPGSARDFDALVRRLLVERDDHTEEEAEEMREYHTEMASHFRLVAEACRLIDVWLKRVSGT